MNDFMDQWIDRIHRQEIERLEGQAKLFIAMGFSPQELMIVQDVDGGNTQVVPHLISLPGDFQGLDDAGNP